MRRTFLFALLTILGCADVATTPESDGGNIADANPDASPSSDKPPCDVIETNTYYNADGVLFSRIREFRAHISGDWRSVWVCYDEPWQGVSLCSDGERLGCYQPSDEYFLPGCTMTLPRRKTDGSQLVVCGSIIEQDTNGDGSFDRITRYVADRVEIWR
jgi:hypothetical protein